MNSNLIVSNLLNPAILFFFLGMLAVLVQSDLEIPAPIPKLFSLYLLLAIGFKGGVELSKSGFSSDQRIAFFTIGYGQSGDFNPDALRTIAELNGGYYSEGTPSTIAQLMADLQLEF